MKKAGKVTVPVELFNWPEVKLMVEQNEGMNIYCAAGIVVWTWLMCAQQGDMVLGSGYPWTQTLLDCGMAEEIDSEFIRVKPWKKREQTTYDSIRAVVDADLFQQILDLYPVLDRPTLNQILDECEATYVLEGRRRTKHGVKRWVTHWVKNSVGRIHAQARRAS